MKNYSEDASRQYHIQVAKGEVGRYVIMPGDPGRCEKIAAYLDDPVLVASNREFTTYTGMLDGEKVSVTSTGIGGPSAAIAMEELVRCGADTFVRIGTCGGMQPEVKSGDIVIATGSIRMEGTSKEYAPIEYPAVADLDITLALRQAAEELQIPHQVGITVTTDSFWPGQERYDSFTGYVPRALQGTLQEWQKLRCSNFEMEAATLFVVANTFGLKAGAICGVVAKRTDSEAVAAPAVYKKAEERFQRVTKRALEILIQEGR